MNTVTQKMMFRQSLIKYSEKNGVTKAAIKYNVTRQYIYFWKRRYEGTLQSFADRSYKPEHHPNQHTEEEIHLLRVELSIKSRICAGVERSNISVNAPSFLTNVHLSRRQTISAMSTSS